MHEVMWQEAMLGVADFVRQPGWSGCETLVFCMLHGEAWTMHTFCVAAWLIILAIRVAKSSREQQLNDFRHLCLVLKSSRVDLSLIEYLKSCIGCCLQT